MKKIWIYYIIYKVKKESKKLIPLKKIQRYVKQYAEVIANILQCEVEIMDENLIRIAGTGYFEKKLGKNVKVQYILMFF